jgi:hypothetical protein
MSQRSSVKSASRRRERSTSPPIAPTPSKENASNGAAPLQSVSINLQDAVQDRLKIESEIRDKLTTEYKAELARSKTRASQYSREITRKFDAAKSTADRLRIMQCYVPEDEREAALQRGRADAQVSSTGLNALRLKQLLMQTDAKKKRMDGLMLDFVDRFLQRASAVYEHAQNADDYGAQIYLNVVLMPQLVEMESALASLVTYWLTDWSRLSELQLRYIAALKEQEEDEDDDDDPPVPATPRKPKRGKRALSEDAASEEEVSSDDHSEDEESN